MLETGVKAPNFVLKNQEDANISLADYKNKWIVLYFYPKDNTSGCTKEACDFTVAKPKFGELDAVVMGVSPDSIKSHNNFIEKHNLDLILLSDPEKEVHKKYGAWGLKKNYGKEYEGVIRSTFIISPDGKIAHSWNNVKVSVKRKSGEVKHVDIVKARLEELKDSNYL